MKKLLIFMIFSVIAFGSEIDNKNSISVPVKVSAEINKLRAYTYITLTTDSGNSNFNIPTTWINRYTESSNVYVRGGNLDLADNNILWDVYGPFVNREYVSIQHKFSSTPIAIPLWEISRNTPKDVQFFLYIGYNPYSDNIDRTIQMQMRGIFRKTYHLSYNFRFRVYRKS